MARMDFGASEVKHYSDVFLCAQCAKAHDAGGMIARYVVLAVLGVGLLVAIFLGISYLVFQYQGWQRQGKVKQFKEAGKAILLANDGGGFIYRYDPATGSYRLGLPGRFESIQKGAIIAVRYASKRGLVSCINGQPALFDTISSFAPYVPPGKSSTEHVIDYSNDKCIINQLPRRFYDED